MHLARVAKGPPEEDTPSVTLKQRDFRLDAAQGRLDSANEKLDSANMTLDVLQAPLNHTDAKVELLISKIENQKANGIKLALACGGIVFAVLVTCQHAPLTAPSSAPQVVNVHVGPGRETAEGARSYDRDDLASGWVRTEPKGGVRSRPGPGMGQRKTGRPMPHTPFPGQAAAPCQGSEKEFYGLCWGEMRADVPCPPDQFQEGGRCYVPVYEAPKKPASETRESPNP